MHAALPQWILNSLVDGAIVIDQDGTLLVVNPAVERLLGIEASAAIGQSFASVFVADEALDELVQALLDAAYQAETSYNRLLHLQRPGVEPRTLALTTSLLHDDAGERLGAVALLHDITEREALRAREQGLNAELSEAHQALSGAYRDLETRNAELGALTKRIALVRNLATGFVLLLFVGIGGYVWNQGGDLGPATLSSASVSVPNGSESPAVLRLEPQAYRDTIKILGTLEPLAVVNLVAALEGTLAERFFEYGDAVNAGDPLFSIGLGSAQVQYRDARAAHLGAMEEVTRLEGWAEGPEMQRARRSLIRAEANLQALKRKQKETRRLLDLGIVAASELESLDEQLLSSDMELAQAREELASTAAQGEEDKLTIARLKLGNAHYSLQEWEEKLAKAEVRAPVEGVVMLPANGQDGGRANPIEVGTLLQEGVAALAIGDLTGLSVKIAVDELEIGRLQPGQRVRVTGEAFPDIHLVGEVERISAQANPAQGKTAPTFDVTVRVPELSVEQRARIRVGMSAQLEIILQDDPAALLVPITAVLQGADGPRVRVREAGQVRETAVTLGRTTLDSVQVLDGLSPGMEILIAP